MQINIGLKKIKHVQMTTQDNSLEPNAICPYCGSDGYDLMTTLISIPDIWCNF